jgi:hypothetical protein
MFIDTELQCLGIHPGDHQHTASCRILSNGGNQSIAVPSYVIEITHIQISLKIYRRIMAVVMGQQQ